MADLNLWDEKKKHVKLGLQPMHKEEEDLLLPRRTMLETGDSQHLAD